MIHTIKGFGIVNKAEVNIFLELSCFFHDPEDVGNLISVGGKLAKTVWPGSFITQPLTLAPFFINNDYVTAKNAEECSNYHTIALNSHTSKVMLKVLQARLQQYVNQELSDVQAGFRKGRGTREQMANIRWIIEKARQFQKNIYFCFTD